MVADTGFGTAKPTLPPNCQSPSGVMIHLDGRTAIGRCKKWPCYPCGKRKAKQLWHRLKGYRFERMVTLTAPASTNPTRENVKRFNYAWKLFKQWMTRNYERFDYLWSNEAGSRSGQLHKHIALPWFHFDYRLARDYMESIIAKRACLGVVCDFGKKRAINYKKAVAYCTSYVLKDRSNFPKYSRRVQTSVRRKCPLGCDFKTGCKQPENCKERFCELCKEPGWKFISLNACLSNAATQPLVPDGDVFAALNAEIAFQLALIQGEKLHAVLPDVQGQEGAK